MKKFYLLDNDYLFKKIFRSIKYLKHLIKEFFGIECKEVKYLNTELIKENKIGKAGIVDLLLEIDGQIIILEMQNINRHNFKNRLLYYSSNIIAKHCLESGKDYSELKPIRVYAIINYNDFNENILDVINLKREMQIFTEILEYRIFDLTKASEKDSELVSLFKEHDLNILEAKLTNKMNKEILRQIERFNSDEKEYKKMDDIVEMLKNETEHYETAEKVGKKIGLSEGIQQGIRQGRREGKHEGKIEVAKNLLSENINVNIISKATGLTNQQILSLK